MGQIIKKSIEVDENQWALVTAKAEKEGRTIRWMIGEAFRLVLAEAPPGMPSGNGNGGATPGLDELKRLVEQVAPGTVRKTWREMTPRERAQTNERDRGSYEESQDPRDHR